MSFEISVSSLTDFSVFLEAMEAQETLFVASVVENSTEKGIVLAFGTVVYSEDRPELGESPFFPTIGFGAKMVMFNGQICSDSDLKEKIIELRKEGDLKGMEIGASISTFEKVGGERANQILLMLVEEGIKNFGIERKS